MQPRPITMAPAQRDLLREFERLHAQWRAASEAADAIECRVLAESQEAQRLLEYRIAADRVHREAMQLLRERPI